MAKKRKGTRKAAASPRRRKGAKKKTTRSARRRPTRRAAAPRKEVDLNPVKDSLRAHIDRLKEVDDPRVREALEGLQSVQRQLTAFCAPTMVIGG
ncbi:MAG TPA: hypothetical protein VD833_00220 [Vicinamibacterales bacterium]|nr:hypothetical protein [Vicinamibacterales bacterium]